MRVTREALMGIIGVVFSLGVLLGLCVDLDG